ncbi:MAG TPA: hypothetical protein ENK43_08135 [Planctomycetes bacterium]|nr:hypothetical protein [Planctomycetota bacterium]
MRWRYPPLLIPTLVLALLATLTPAQVLLTEDFSTAAGMTAPAGWTTSLVVGSNAFQNWRFDNPNPLSTISAPLTSPIAICDSDFLGFAAGPVQAELISPTFDASSGIILLEWDQWHRIFGGTGNSSIVNVFVNDGIADTLVYTNDSGTANPDHQSIDITAAANGSPNASLRFEYIGHFDFWWQVDNIEVRSEPLPDFPGTDEDLELESGINTFMLSGGSQHIQHDVFPGDVVTLRLHSPNGTFLGLNFSFLATLYPMGGTVNLVSPAFPGIYANAAPPPFGTVSVLGSGDLSLFGVPALLPLGGVSFSFQWPVFIAPTERVMIQGLVTGTVPANGFFATTDGHVFVGN